MLVYIKQLKPGKFTKVDVSQECYNNMVDSVVGMYTFEEGADAGAFRESIYKMMGLLFE